MNNRAANTPSGVQWTGLLLLVVCFGLAASWIIKSWSYDSDTTDVSRIEEASNNSVRPSIDIETAKTPHDDVSLQPTIALPRQSFVISGDQLELECGSFIDRLQTNLPNDSKALNLAALFYSRTQQTIKADELWKKVLSMAPRDLSLYFNWSSNAIQQGQSDRALEILDQAERNGVRDPQLLYQRSVSLSNLGRDEEVESLLVPFATSKEMDGIGTRVTAAGTGTGS
jgi:tetratricopeptide (TPR) repeat protein